MCNAMSAMGVINVTTMNVTATAGTVGEATA